MIPPDPTLAAAKAQMRTHAVMVRRQADQRLCATAPALLAALAGQIAQAPQVVAGYWPMGDEMDVRPLMAALSRTGCPLALPVVTASGQKLDFRAWSPGDILEPGPHGTSHPLLHAEILVPQVVLLPMLAFDRHGWRLGYGGGYYDRTLESLRAQIQVKMIGVAYADQQVDAVPHDGYDQRLDAVMTEAGLIMELL